MSRTKKTKVTPKHVLPPAWRGFDLRTEEGTKAAMDDRDRRKAIALEFYGADFANAADHFDDASRAFLSVMADLVGQEMHDTVNELARLGRALYLARIGLPIPNGKTKEAAVAS